MVGGATLSQRRSGKTTRMGLEGGITSLLLLQRQNEMGMLQGKKKSDTGTKEEGDEQ